MIALWPKTKQFLNLTVSYSYSWILLYPLTITLCPFWALQLALVVRNPPANLGDKRDTASIPGRRAWQPTPVFLPGESYGQRSLAGYSPYTRVRHNWSDLAHVHYLPSAPPSMQESNVAIYKKELLNRNQSTTFNSY